MACLPDADKPFSFSTNAQVHPVQSIKFAQVIYGSPDMYREIHGFMYPLALNGDVMKSFSS